MKPSIGRIVHYKLSDYDADAINASASRHNKAYPGDIYPAIIVRTFGGDAVNLQVFLDGEGCYWATSRGSGDAENQWRWPERV